MQFPLLSSRRKTCPICGRPSRRWLVVSLLDLFGVLFLTLFLGGVVLFFVGEGFLTRLSGRWWGGSVVLGLLFLIGFAWKFFLQVEIRTDEICPHCRPRGRI